MFDNFGRVTESKQITDGSTYTSKYTFSFTGALIQEEYPSGRIVKNEYESDGDIARIFGSKNATSPEKTFANTFRYTPDGKIESLRLGNGLWESAKFNNRMQPTEINLGRGVVSGDLWKLTYEYGELESNGTVSTAKNTGNIARQTVSFNGLSHPFVQSYKYDALQRLTEAKETKNGTQIWLQQFGYDIYGNRNSTNQSVNGSTITTTPAVDANTNRFTSTSFQYDKNGNITRDTSLANASRTFVFNADNKQRKVLDANGNPIGTYYYDGEGKRVKKVTATETTIYVFSGGKLVAEYTNTTPPTNPTVSYTATDLLGSPRVLTDSLGAVVSRRDFLPFGEEVYADEANRTSAQKYTTTGDDGLRKRFTGYEKDKETQLDFAEARMYENRYGRFTAVDPLLASGKSGNPKSFNRYVYCFSNPLAFTDPDGLQAGRWYRQVNENGEPYVGNRIHYLTNGSDTTGFRRLPLGTGKGS
ncbi:MAG TPA: RHS repeat-associated core domain-containing protein [Pyrinomonadaceae bacterium]|nr:RHS repeat-associated core domain-containing protein [Pyrinomonadaceae bacterium]